MLIPLSFTVQLIKKSSFTCKITVSLGSIYVLLKAHLLFEELKEQRIYYLSPTCLFLNPLAFSFPAKILSWPLVPYDTWSLMSVIALTHVYPKHLRGCSATCVLCSELKSGHLSLARVQKFLVKHCPESTHRQHDCFSHISR